MYRTVGLQDQDTGVDDDVGGAIISVTSNRAERTRAHTQHTWEVIMSHGRETVTEGGQTSNTVLKNLAGHVTYSNFCMYFLLIFLLSDSNSTSCGFCASLFQSLISSHYLPCYQVSALPTLCFSSREHALHNLNSTAQGL